MISICRHVSSLVNIKNIHHLSLEDMRHQPPFFQDSRGHWWRGTLPGFGLFPHWGAVEVTHQWWVNGDLSSWNDLHSRHVNYHDNPMQIWSKYQSWSLGVLDGICWNTPCFGQGQTVFFCMARSLQLFAASLSSVGNVETIRRRQLLEAPSRHGIPIDVSDVWICPQIGSPFEIDQQIYTLQR